jgi:hypothetical protein
MYSSHYLDKRIFTKGRKDCESKLVFAERFMAHKVSENNNKKPQIGCALNVLICIVKHTVLQHSICFCLRPLNLR